MVRKNSDRKLMDRLAADPAHGHLLGVLATTYNLDPSFLETDFLPAVLGLGVWDDRSWASRVALENGLAGLEAVSVLTDQRCYRERPRSLRIEVKPAVGAGGQLLHAKVMVLVHEHAVRFNAGSANLTGEGYRENREVVLPLIASDATPAASALVLKALGDMRALLDPWWTEAAERVRTLAMERLQRWAGSEPDGTHFVWSGGDEPLWMQFLSKWPRGERVQRIDIVSPFWSEEGPRGPLTKLVSSLRAEDCLEPGADLRLHVEAEAGERGQHRPRVPALGDFDPAALGFRAVAVAVDPRPADDDVGDDVLKTRKLHAKIVLLQGPATTLAYVGSANFTVPGWGFTSAPRQANLEAGFILRRASGSWSAELLPPSTGEPEPITAGGQGAKVPTPDPEPVVPTFMREVRLEPRDAETLQLAVVIDPAKVLGPFRIALHEGRTLCEGGQGVAAEQRLGLDAATLHELLAQQQVSVYWWAAEEPAGFPVNVTLAARTELPIAPGDGKPGEDLLVRYYQGKIAYPELFPPPPGWEDEDENAAPAPAIEENHADTSRIQSYQVREFVEALQGIRDDLGGARASTEAAMRLALFGPVSPVALARQIRDASLGNRRSQTAAGFQLVEIAGCLFEATSEGEVDSAWARHVNTARELVEALLAEIVQLHATELGPKTAFHRYRGTILSNKTAREAR